MPLNDELTAAELVEIDLPTAMRGYRVEEVDALIDRVADALDQRDALLRALTEDRDKLLLELRDAEDRISAAQAGVGDAEATARTAVEEARRLRERVQGRAESLLADAARRADELRAQGRAESAELVRLASLEAERVTAERISQREIEEASHQARLREVRRALDEAERVSERARRRVRDELQRQLDLSLAWDQTARHHATEDEGVVQAAASALEQEHEQEPEPTEPGTEAMSAAELETPDWATTEDADVQDRDSSPRLVERERVADEPAVRASFAELAGLDESDLADLQEPWLISQDPDSGRS